MPGESPAPGGDRIDLIVKVLIVGSGFEWNRDGMKGLSDGRTSKPKSRCEFRGGKGWMRNGMLGLINDW